MVFILVGGISFLAQQQLTEDIGNPFNGLLEKAYAFLFGYSLGLVLLFQGWVHLQKQVQQLGFLYLAFLLLKIFVFAALFHPFFLGDQLLPFSQRAALLVPVVVFLILEVFFITKTMHGIKG